MGILRKTMVTDYFWDKFHQKDELWKPSASCRGIVPLFSLSQEFGIIFIVKSICIMQWFNIKKCILLIYSSSIFSTLKYFYKYFKNLTLNIICSKINEPLLFITETPCHLQKKDPRKKTLKSHRKLLLLGT